MLSEKGSHWYAIYTNSRAEKKVHERLLEAGFESFLPLITTVKQWSDRKKKVSVPLINSYVFVKINKQKLNTVLPIAGVFNILKHLGEPAIVRDFEIENLRILDKNTDAVKVVESIHIEIGTAVEVVKGPFAGLIAKKINASGAHRIIVEVEALGNFIEVTVPLSHIREYIK